MSQSVRTCSQCTATTAAGTRCRKRTCRGPVCWQHAQSQHGLRVKPSQIQNAGFGLFATKRMAKTPRMRAPTSPVHSESSDGIDLTHTDNESESDWSTHSSDNDFIDDSDVDTYVQRVAANATPRPEHAPRRRAARRTPLLALLMAASLG